MKAIETIYRGYRFRSRLEARWAVFFDALGLRWEYEPEGFVMDDGTMYLPDFRVVMPSGFIRWYEVKHEHVAEDRKVKLFAESMDRHSGITLLSGEPASVIDRCESDGNGGICPRCGDIGQFDYGIWDSGGEVCIGCFHCDADTPCGGGHPNEQGIWMPYRPHKGSIVVDRHDWRHFTGITIPMACAAARSARFEHNEREMMARV